MRVVDTVIALRPPTRGEDPAAEAERRVELAASLRQSRPASCADTAASSEQTRALDLLQQSLAP